MDLQAAEITPSHTPSWFPKPVTAQPRVCLLSALRWEWESCCWASVCRILQYWLGGCSGGANGVGKDEPCHLFSHTSPFSLLISQRQQIYFHSSLETQPKILFQTFLLGKRLFPETSHSAWLCLPCPLLSALQFASFPSAGICSPITLNRQRTWRKLGTLLWGTSSKASWSWEGSESRRCEGTRSKWDTVLGMLALLLPTTLWVRAGGGEGVPWHQCCPSSPEEDADPQCWCLHSYTLFCEVLPIQARHGGFPPTQPWSVSNWLSIQVPALWLLLLRWKIWCPWGFTYKNMKHLCEYIRDVWTCTCLYGVWFVCSMRYVWIMVHMYAVVCVTVIMQRFLERPC